MNTLMRQTTFKFKGTIKPTPARIGDVVQLSPELPSPFAGFFMTVTESKPWGAVGIIRVLGRNGPSRNITQTLMRVNWADLSYVGRSKWQDEL